MQGDYLNLLVMRPSICAILLLIGNHLYGQMTTMVLPKSAIENSGIAYYFKDKIPQGSEIKLANEVKNSKVYNVYYLGFPVQGCQIVTVQFGQKVAINASVNSNILFEKIAAENNLINAEWLFMETQNTYGLFGYSDSSGFRIYTHLLTGETFVEDKHRYLGKDTFTKGFVNFPDPLSSANKLYGGNYKDGNDFNYSELAAERKEVVFNCKFYQDSFRLESPYFSFKEISFPVNQHAVGKGPLFYSRDMDAFEEVNVFYHLSQLCNWWDSLGFGHYRDSVVIDVHAYFNADQSGLDPLVNPPTIEFGDGGVDDAEDADAPVHEYTHAAFHLLNPNAYIGTQRQAIEEGICDFMAVAYSNRITKNQNGWVYNWDGHNEFWAGRTLVNSRYFPVDITNQSHVDGQLFGAALFDLANEIGYDSTLKIVFHAMPLMLGNITMREAANLLFLADSLANNGRTRWAMIKAFYPRGLLPQVGVETIKETMVLQNSDGFAVSSSNLVVHPLVTGTLKIFAVSGELVLEKAVAAGEELELFPSDFVPGTYILRLSNSAYKILKF